MISDSSRLKPGQILKIDIDKLTDRLPTEISKKISNNPYGTLVGYKMVDGNQFGLVLKLEDDLVQWFFEDELSIPTD